MMLFEVPITAHFIKDLRWPAMAVSNGAVSNGGGRQSGPAVCGERTAFCTDRGILSEVWPPIKPAIKPAIKPSERRRAGSRGLRPSPGPHPGVKGGFEAIRRPLPGFCPGFARTWPLGVSRPAGLLGAKCSSGPGGMGKRGAKAGQRGVLCKDRHIGYGRGYGLGSWLGATVWGHGRGSGSSGKGPCHPPARPGSI